MALRDEYYLRFHFILVIRRAFFSIISMDQIFQAARQTCCRTPAAQDAWDIPLPPLGTPDLDSPLRPDPMPRGTPGWGQPAGVQGSSPVLVGGQQGRSGRVTVGVPSALLGEDKQPGGTGSRGTAQQPHGRWARAARRARGGLCPACPQPREPPAPADPAHRLGSSGHAANASRSRAGLGTALGDESWWHISPWV